MVEALIPADPNIVLKPFTKRDFSELSSWFVNAREARLWGGPLVRYPVDDRQLLEMLREASGPAASRRCWSAFVGLRLAGHAQALLEQKGVVRLARIAVAPQFRRRGIARAMLRPIIDEIFTDPSVGRINLNVYADNRSARSLYRGLGFVATLQRAEAGQQPERVTMTLDRSFWIPG